MAQPVQTVNQSGCIPGAATASNASKQERCLGAIPSVNHVATDGDDVNSFSLYNFTHPSVSHQTAR